jgi:5-methylcytosine-specific restriction endonuclease McrA
VKILDDKTRELLFGAINKRKKRKTLTAAQRIYIWEHPKIYGRKCSICSSRITKLSDLELDHTRVYSKGGKKLALAHKQCNRLKGSGSLRGIQKTLGLKATKRKKTKRRKKSQTKRPYWINPITGKKEYIGF